MLNLLLLVWVWWKFLLLALLTVLTGLVFPANISSTLIISLVVAGSIVEAQVANCCVHMLRWSIVTTHYTIFNPDHHFKYVTLSIVPSQVKLKKNSKKNIFKSNNFDLIKYTDIKHKPNTDVRANLYWPKFLFFCLPHTATLANTAITTFVILKKLQKVQQSLDN